VPSCPDQDTDVAELVALIKHSTLLDGTLHRSWLRLVPEMSPRDRERLSAILREESPKQRGVARGERGAV
jgi:hypothetical protein